MQSGGGMSGISGSGLDSNVGPNPNTGTTDVPIKDMKSSNEPKVKEPPQTMPDVKDKFEPQPKDDNMMAENDPVKRQPERWQAETKKDPI